MARSGKLSSAAAGAILVLAAVAAYHNSFAGPFVFDDGPSIIDNPTIRHLWPLWAAMSPPPGGLTVSGRPVLNLTLAVNYALGGTSVWGYHALNLLIHILAGLTLFGILSRTFKRARIGGWSGLSAARSLDSAAQPVADGPRPCWLALAIAVIWTVHPLQTESVTYVIQRAESLMGLFYLLTLYGFIRSVESEGSTQVSGLRSQVSARSGLRSQVSVPALRFQILSVAACICGMATKEVMVSAPVIVFLYDRTFVSGSFAGAWERHWKLHVALGLTWFVLLAEVIGASGRGGTAGFGTGIPWTLYGLTQVSAVAHYLKLSLWPHPLVFDYGPHLVHSISEIPAAAAVVLALIGITAWGLVRAPAIGFAGACFIAILAPSSSIVPIATETIAEHRMYLALAPLLSLIACLAASAWEYCTTERGPVRRSPAARDAGGYYPQFIPLSLLAAIALAFIATTIQRNKAYASETALWRDTLAQGFGNPRAHYDLGVALLHQGNDSAARAELEEAIRLAPDYADALMNLGLVLLNEGHNVAAIDQFQKAVGYKPGSPAAHADLGRGFAATGQLSKALAEFDEAIRIQPDYPGAYRERARALAAQSRDAEAYADYRRALDLSPNDAGAHAGLGAVLADMGRLPEAVSEFQAAYRIVPGTPEDHYILGNLMVQSGDLPGAMAEFREAIRRRPAYAEAHANLGGALANAGRLADSVPEFQAALRLDPDLGQVHYNLGQVLHALGRDAEAKPELEAAARLQAKPDDASR